MLANHSSKRAVSARLDAKNLFADKKQDKNRQHQRVDVQAELRKQQQMQQKKQQ